VLVPNGNAGAATLVTITTRDASGNATTIPAGITVGVSGANSFVPAVTDHHDGTYTASYAPTHSGTDLVSVTLAGTAVLGSPWASVVHAGPVSSTLSTLQLVPAQVVASSGAEQATVTVVARDGYGNGVPGVTVGLSASGFSNTFAPLAPLTDPSGSAVSHFSSTLAGSRTVTATIGGVSWTQNVTVVAGPADPRQSGATVPGSAHRHQFTVMALQTRDQFGNTLTTGGHTVSFSVTGANHAGPLNAVDIGDGSYVMSYLPSSKGTDTIAILLDGVPVQGSPYRSNVH
jgi:adhesin/invasin